MKIDVRHASHPDAVRGYDTQTLRRHYLIETLFQPGEISLVYSHHDRMIVGGAVPLAAPLELGAPREIGQDTFFAEREAGILCIGGKGAVTVGDTRHTLEKYDCLYVGRGEHPVRLESADAADPAIYYIVSAPAHASHPTVLLTRDKARQLTAGDPATANKRSIFQFIHPEVCDSCQLTMGLTMLEPGSVWNTMPSHTHDRRMEAYLYIDLDADQRVFHLMGEPRETRHLVVANRQAIISPPWSIHSGVGTKNYSFIWAMAGDNKSFTDMDHLAISELQ